MKSVFVSPIETKKSDLSNAIAEKIKSHKGYKNSRIKISYLFDEKHNKDNVVIVVETLPNSDLLQCDFQLNIETYFRMQSLKSKHKTWDKIFNELLDKAGVPLQKDVDELPSPMKH